MAAGREIILPPRPKYQTTWLSWYQGKVPGFHDYRVYNGTGNYIDCERKTLQMGKKIPETWANLLINEKCAIVVPDAPKKKLDEILKAAKFWRKANGAIEKSFALGLGAFVVSVHGILMGDQGTVLKDKGKLRVEFVNGMKVHPITIEDREIVECAFESQTTSATLYSVHLRDANENYIIHNYAFDNDDKAIPEKTFVFETKSPYPWFAILMPNVESNFLTTMNDDELGISIFANSTDTLRALDNKYDGFDVEFTLSRKKVFVNTKLWQVKKDVDTNSFYRAFDPMDTLFQATDGDDGKQQITETGGEIRYEAYIRGINAELNYLAMGCGLGEHYYKFDGTSIATATQVISEGSVLFQNIKKQENLIEDVLRTLTLAIIHASNNFTNNPVGEVKPEEITIRFDDSIIEDKDAQMKRDLADVNAGIMTKVEYRMKWYGEDEKTATEKVFQFFRYEIIDKYQTALSEGSITPEDFVKEVYGDKSDGEQKAIVEYITTFVKPSGQNDMNSFYKTDEFQPNDDGSLNFVVKAKNQAGKDEDVDVKATDEEGAKKQVMDMLDIPVENIISVKRS